MDRLARRGKLDDTVIVITADHGEGLYECSTCLGHGDNLRGIGTLRVPLAFVLPEKRFPEGKPRVVEAWSSQLDIYPTILSLLGEPPIVTHEGVPLLLRSGARATTPERIFTAETGEWLWTTSAVPKTRLEYPPITGLARIEKGRIEIDPKYDPVIRAGKHRAAIRWPYKLDYEPSADGVAWRLFKIDDDPFQDHDVTAEHPHEAAELRAALRQAVLRHPSVMAVGDHFVSRPPMPPEEEW
jgi:arylsulfatase A-like enzyme